MKKLLGIIIALGYLCNIVAQDYLTIELTIDKIDSTNSYYILYAKDSILQKYKIISQKIDDKIPIGRHCVKENETLILEILPMKLNTFNNDFIITCFDLDFEIKENEFITIEQDWGGDLYLTKTIKGLYVDK